MSGQDTEFREWSDKCHIAGTLTVAMLNAGTAKTGGTNLTITLDHALQTAISCVDYSVAMQVVTSRSSSASTA